MTPSLAAARSLAVRGRSPHKKKKKKFPPI